MPDPVPGSPEHAANMLAKARGITYEEALKQFAPAASAAPPTAASGAAAAGAAQRPEHIPEKFWDAAKGSVNVDALAKSYGELEKKHSGSSATSTETTVAVTPPVDGLPTIEIPAVDPAVARAASFKAASDKAAQEFSQGGKISDESYKALADLGVAREHVDAFAAGQKARGDQYVAQLHAAAGGKEAYDKMAAWAKAGGITPDEAKGFNAVLRSGNLDAVKVTVGGLKARFEGLTGKAPDTFITPTPTDSQRSVAGFQSGAEMTKAMADPRYQKGDPAYHAEVRQKIALAKQAGTNLDLHIIQNR